MVEFVHVYRMYSTLDVDVVNYDVKRHCTFQHLKQKGLLAHNSLSNAIDTVATMCMFYADVDVAN